MSKEFHLVTVGWGIDLIENLWRPVAEKSDCQVSHIIHPRNFQSNTASDCPNIHYFSEESGQLELPEKDIRFLAGLEREGVPSLNNMILGDRIVSKLAYNDALRYATFIAHRLTDLLTRLRPSVVIGGFDAIHGGLALAVSRKLGVPWFAMNFSVIPPGLACFCDEMSPASRVSIREPDVDDVKRQAEIALQGFESKLIQAHAHVAATPPSALQSIMQLPEKIAATKRTIRKSRKHNILRFTDEHRSFSVPKVLQHYRRAAHARSAIRQSDCISEPPDAPFVLFGLHMQPESSIDVWAPYFSNQIWVIELISRSIPPTHRLLVKIHKSDVSNYSESQLQKMRSFPGVELVEPFTDSRDFLRRAELVVAIQGTMGLEAALMGKPVIMLAKSPLITFPNVSQLGVLSSLPHLVRKKLTEKRPSRTQIIDAYADFLSPFIPASHNDWNANIGPNEFYGYAEMISALENHLTEDSETLHQEAPAIAEDF